MRAARESPRALGDYLRGFDRGKPVTVLEGPPSIRGHFFYREDMSGFNFARAPGHHRRDHRTAAGAGRRPESAGVVRRVDAHRRITCRRSRPRNPHAAAAATDAAAHLDRQHASRCRRTSTCSSNIACVVGGGGASRCSRPSRSRTCTSGPIDFTHLRAADQHGAAEIAGPRALPALRRSAAPFAQRGARARRRASTFPTAGGITSNR